MSISVGCNNTCTFCIVPSLRGRERDRRPGDILDEITALVGDGVIEVTLLGQNVNSYGAEFGDRQAFGKLLRACGEIEGLERVRFTSPHPRDFTDDVIEAMAETPNVMPSLHMPLQSGSDTVLKAMRRAYRRDRYLAILDNVAGAIPHAAITTDIIVGFPGETEADFAETLYVVRQARFSSAFTFQYSIRPGTPAATMDGQVPADVVQDRYDRLVALVEEVATGRTRGWTARPWRSSWPRGRGARTRRRTACRAAPGTTAWCTSPRMTPPRGPVTSSTRPRPAPRRITCIADGGRSRSAAPGRATPGRPLHPGGDPWTPPRRQAAPRRPRARAGPARHARPPRYGHADRHRRGRPRPASRTWRWSSRSRSTERWSTPTPCSSTGAWTSAQPS